VIHISNGITKHFGRDRQLKLKIYWDVGGEKLSPVLPLIDNGADVCLVNKGFIPKHFFQPAKRSLHLIGANGQLVKVGHGSQADIEPHEN